MKVIQTKRSRIVNHETLIVTVDIGKIMNMGYWRTPNGTAEAKPFEFSNDSRGFNKLWNNISEARKNFNLKEIVVGFESTGCYGEPLLHFLRKKKIIIVQVNPVHTKRLKELQGNSPSKTDQKDPKVVADIIELGHALTTVIPEGSAAELRRLTHARERCLRRRTALLNQLQDLIFIVFPEFLGVMKNVKTKSSRYILTNIASPQSIIEYGVENLSLQLKKTSRGQLGKERAEELNQAAWQSVGIQEGQDSIFFEIRELISLIEKSERFVVELEIRMSEHLKHISYSKFILSIKGIGEITAAGLIGEVGDFNKFSTVSELQKLAGLDLFEISSGKHQGKRRISKRGRPLLRKLLYFAALSVIRKDGIFHDWYQSALERGMIKMKALVAVSRKLLGIIFALVRNQSLYVLDYARTQALKAVA